MRHAPWTDYLLGFAQHAALKSKDQTKVGAVLVRDKTMLCSGFNGAPRRVRDLPERYSREGGVKYRYVTHAEANAIATAARNGLRTDGAEIYVTHFPCSSCARLIIQAGIVKVVAGAGTTSMPPEEFQAAREMFDEAGVEIVEIGEVN